MENKNLKKLYLSSGILEKWHDKTWADFTNDNEAKKTIQKYLSNYKGAKKAHESHAAKGIYV